MQSIFRVISGSRTKSNSVVFPRTNGFVATGDKGSLPSNAPRSLVLGSWVQHQLGPSSLPFCSLFFFWGLIISKISISEAFVLNESEEENNGQLTTLKYLCWDSPASQGWNLVNFRTLHFMFSSHCQKMGKDVWDFRESGRLATKILEVNVLFFQELEAKPAAKGQEVLTQPVFCLQGTQGQCAAMSLLHRSLL